MVVGIKLISVINLVSVLTMIMGFYMNVYKMLHSGLYTFTWYKCEVILQINKLILKLQMHMNKSSCL